MYTPCMLRDLAKAEAFAPRVTRAHPNCFQTHSLLRSLMIEKLGPEWMSTWWHGLPGAYDTPTGQPCLALSTISRHPHARGTPSEESHTSSKGCLRGAQLDAEQKARMVHQMQKSTTFVYQYFILKNNTRSLSAGAAVDLPRHRDKVSKKFPC